MLQSISHVVSSISTLSRVLDVPNNQAGCNYSKDSHTTASITIILVANLRTSWPQCASCVWNAVDLTANHAPCAYACIMTSPAYMLYALCCMYFTVRVRVESTHTVMIRPGRAGVLALGAAARAFKLLMRRGTRWAYYRAREIRARARNEMEGLPGLRTQWSPGAVILILFHNTALNFVYNRFGTL